MKRIRMYLVAVFMACAASAAWSESDGMETAQAAFGQALTAYQSGDWYSSQILLRKAMSYPANNTEAVVFMLISAEMYGEDYTAALHDSELFLQQFPDSTYVSYVRYQYGRALFYTGAYDQAIMVLSDFCHTYPEHDLYPSALFWIAESFYAGYSYDDALGLYTRIVTDFPEDAKAPAAQYRIETINQRDREEKLLYLLRQTGEEYLAAREEYERWMRTQTATSATELRQRMIDLQSRNTELEAQVAELRRTVDRLMEENRQFSDAAADAQAEEIRLLKLKAHQIQELLDQRGTSQ
ncbi:MAG: tetratricopeptide repeat protein [Treponema sp.]|nr:tetratricopeptide repeat protein [Treponema sp.]